MAEALRARAADRPQHVFLRFEDRTWTFADVYAEACRCATLLLRERRPGCPFHVGVLMDNVPAFVFAELGCALAGATLVGLNPTRTGEHLARDVAYADCQILLVEPCYAEQLAGALATGAERPPVVFVAGDTERRGWKSLNAETQRLPSSDPGVAVTGEDLLLIVFTSGTTQAPKGVLSSHRRLMMLGWGASVHMCQFTPDDTVYCAMPLFHANAQILALVPALLAGGTIALARRFSKSAFLADVRRHGATLFNYVGTPFAYILDTPARHDDTSNPLRLAYGNEAPRHHIDAFAKRFGCRVVDGYGASEVGVGFSRQAGDPPGSLGRADGVAILDEEGHECPVARFATSGRLINAEEAIGEIVNTAGRFMFEGYYKDEASTRERTRQGRFYTGDLGYRDADGFIYFAGRDAEWIRVGGENFLARPIEEALARHPDVVLVSAYGVPDPEAGDQVMAAVQLRSGATFDALRFTVFVDDESGLPPRWRPRFLRLASTLNLTHTNKVLKRTLQREKFRLDRVGDPLFWRPQASAAFEPFTASAYERLASRFAAAGHTMRLEE